MSARRKVLTVISFLLTFILMGVIFYLSDQPASESSQLSDSLISKIFHLIGVIIPVKVIRKTAHACEFFLLAFLFSNSFNLASNEKWHILSLALTFAYACTDEFHQLFVFGRAGRISDILIDTSGALIGILIYSVLIKIIKAVRRRKDVSNPSVQGNKAG